MPFVTNPRKAATDLVGKRLAELARPLSDGFVADDDAAGRQREDKAVPMATMPRFLSLCPQAVSIDESPVDLEAEAGSVVEVQVTVAQFRMLTKDAVSQRISLPPTV